MAVNGPTHSIGVIYIIDDDPTVLRATAGLVSHLALGLAIEVHTFPNGEDFLEHTKLIPPRAPCCLVMDLHVPGKRVFDVQQDLDKRLISMPLIVISGDLDGFDTLGSDGVVVSDRLAKPFSAEQLERSLRRALASQHRLTRENP